jgi:hypothetical protein
MMEMKKGEAAGVPRQAVSSPLRLLTSHYFLLTSHSDLSSAAQRALRETLLLLRSSFEEEVSRPLRLRRGGAEEERCFPGVLA